MQLKSTGFINKVLNLVTNKADTIEFAENWVKFPTCSLHDISLKQINSALILKEGIFSTSILITLKSGEQIKSARFSKDKARDFVDQVNLQWETTIVNQFKLIKYSFEQLNKVIERLEKPRKYPAASVVTPFLNEARKLIALLPFPLPSKLFNETDMKLIEKITHFTENADTLRRMGVKQYIAHALEREKEFFDHFESNPLTNEQRKAVVTDEDSTLVLASAGSGKTSVITAKVAHLLKNKMSQANQILVLAYARNAATEMKDRFQKSIGTEVNVTTFHALGYDIINSVDGKKPALAAFVGDDIGLRNHLKDIIQTHLFHLKPIRNLLIKWFSELMVPYRTEWDFKTLDEYYTFVEEKNFRTLKGHLVKGYEELLIANWLFINGINYEYESTYEIDIPGYDRREYQPDFFLPEAGIYIEHWGVRWQKNSKGEKFLATAPGRDQEDYIKGIEWKRAIHQKYDTKLIETFSYEFKSNELTKLLEQKLATHKVFPRPVSLDTILESLNSIGLVDKLTNTLATFLRHYKNSGANIDACKNRTITDFPSERNQVFLKIFEPLYNEYQKRLGDRIDFEDMIIHATEHVKSGRYKSPFQYILVDEFQDISEGRAKFLLALKKQSVDTKVFAVGDDWQSIYRFSGSDLSLIQNYGNLFGGEFIDQNVFERVNLTTTFRCSEQIAQVACKFILKNPSQIEKQIRSITNNTQPAVQIEFYQKGKLNKKIQEVLVRIVRDKGQDSIKSVLLLGRYHRNLPENFKQLKTQFPKLKLDFKTVHASKGLEADYVILLEVNNQSFPSEIIDDPVLDLVLPVPENYEHAEERRLFYVALTRAKNSVTILADPNSPSCFVKELINDPNYNIQSMLNEENKSLKCPNCSGGMNKVKAKNGNVYLKCQHQQLCDTFLPSCSTCQSDLPIKHSELNSYICSCGAEFVACTECSTGWLVTRSSKYGDFLGCINFPQCTGKSKFNNTKVGKR